MGTMSLLAALVVGIHAVPLWHDLTTTLSGVTTGSSSSNSGGSVSTELSPALEDALTSFITASLNGIIAKEPCAAGTSSFTVTKLKDVTSGIDQADLDYYQLTVETNKGEIDMRLDVVAGSSPPSVKKAKDFSTFDIFPPCVQTKLEAARSLAAKDETPSTDSEKAIFSNELANSAAKGADEAGHEDPSQLTAMIAQNLMAKTSLYGKHNLSKTHNGHGLGHIRDPKATAKYRVDLVDASFASTSAADFTAVPNECITNFPARDQGSCGSCWSFSSSSSVSLNYCKYVYDQGYSYADTNIPVLSTQNMVTCPKDFGADNGGGLHGCDGGTAYSAFAYIKKYGITSSACLPYMSGSSSSTSGGVVNPSGSSSGSADAALSDSMGGCYSQCTSAYRALHPASPMRFISGDASTSPMSFVGEANIMAALQQHGALWASFDVTSTFTSPSDWDEYIYADSTGSARGAHAVVLFGWGTSTKGVKYWKLINSWGSWGIPGTNGHFYMKRGVDLHSIESGGAWTVPLDVNDVHLGPPSNQFTCEEGVSYSGSTIATSTVKDVTACKQACFNDAGCGAFTYDPGPTAAPTTAPSAAPTAACADDTSWSAFGNGNYPCSFFDGSCTYYRDYGQLANCPVTCATCPVASPPPPPPLPPPGTCQLKSEKGGSSSPSSATSCTLTRASPPPANPPPPPPPSPKPGHPPATPGSTADVCKDVVGANTCLRSSSGTFTCSQAKPYCGRYSCVRDGCPVTCADEFPDACRDVCADRSTSCLSTSSGALTCAQAKSYCGMYSCMASSCPTTCGGGGSYGTCVAPATAGKAKLLELFGKVANVKVTAGSFPSEEVWVS